MVKRAVPKISEVSTKKQANFWGVTFQTIRNWRKIGLDPDNIEQIREWNRGLKKQSPPVVAKLAALGKTIPVNGIAKDPHWAEFQAARAKRQDGGQDADQFAFKSIEEMRDFYAFKLNRATESGDQREAGFLTDQVLRFDKSIRDNQLAAKKLGTELGDIIPREICQAWLRAWAFWLMRGIDGTLAALCPAIAGIVPGISEEQVRRAAEPILLDERLLQPFARSAKLAAQLAAPAWAIETAKDAIDDYIENGAALFEAATRGTPDAGKAAAAQAAKK